jgi:hypothetical protein
MMGFGMIIAFIGYTIVYWGVQAIQIHDQPNFQTYVFPWMATP